MEEIEFERGIKARTTKSRQENAVRFKKELRMCSSLDLAICERWIRGRTRGRGRTFSRWGLTEGTEMTGVHPPSHCGPRPFLLFAPLLMMHFCHDLCGIIHYLMFYSWLISLSIYSGFIHIVLCIRMYSFLQWITLHFHIPLADVWVAAAFTKYN